MPTVTPHLPWLQIVRGLPPDRLELLESYARMMREMNRKVNLVARGSETQIESIHIPHVLAFAMRSFPDGASIVDWGTGGGLPAIPLAILFPEVTVHAVDATEKKILAVRSMTRRLSLTNVKAWSGDAAAWPGRATHSVSRATAPLADLWHWHSRVAAPSSTDATMWRPGLLCLKGGDLTAEIAALKESVKAMALGEPGVDLIPIQDLYASSYFEGKYIVHVYERTD